MHHEIIEEIPERGIWIQCWSTVQDTWVWNVPFTKIGGEVGIHDRKPCSHKEPSDFQKWFCAVLWFVCIPVSMIYQIIYCSFSGWNITGVVTITIENFYYDLGGNLLAHDLKTCTGQNSCDVYHRDQGWPWPLPTRWPEFADGTARGVVTRATVKLDEQIYTYFTWESDGDQPSPPPP